MSDTRILIPVELLGGPFDGHEAEVVMNDLNHDVYLFSERGETHAYAWRGTSSTDGKRWLLGHLQKVGRKGVPCP
jgi:hypothetical protein